MEIQNRALLTNEQQIEVRAWEEFFASPGWTLLIQEAQKELEIVENDILVAAKDTDELYYLRGQRSKLLQTVLREQMTEASYNGLTSRAEVQREELADSIGANA